MLFNKKWMRKKGGKNDEKVNRMDVGTYDVGLFDVGL